jgi:hypothetical protein
LKCRASGVLSSATNTSAADAMPTARLIEQFDSGDKLKGCRSSSERCVAGRIARASETIAGLRATGPRLTWQKSMLLRVGNGSYRVIF